MENMLDRFSIYNRTHSWGLIFILDRNHNATISKVVCYVQDRFSEQHFPSVVTKQCDLYEIWLFHMQSELFSIQQLLAFTKKTFVWTFLVLFWVLLNENIIYFSHLHLLDPQLFPANSHLALDPSNDCISNYNSPSIQEFLVSNFTFFDSEAIIKVDCVFHWAQF